MIMFELIIGLKMSTTGPRIPCTGSRRPQELSRAWGLGTAFSLDEDLVEGVASPFRRLPPFLIFEPLVVARGRDVTPALRALTMSLQYVNWPSAAPFSIGPEKEY